MNKYFVIEILFFISLILIVLVYVRFFIFSFICKKKNINISGYDICKMIVDKYNLFDVNIVEVRDNIRNVYNINRRVIRLFVDNYNGTDSFSVYVSCLLGGYAMMHNNGNKYFNFINRFFSFIGFYFFGGVIGIIISYLFKGYYAFMGIILLILLFIYVDIRFFIFNELSVCFDDIDFDNKDVIKKLYNYNCDIYRVSLIVIILQVCGLFMYIMG